MRKIILFLIISNFLIGCTSVQTKMNDTLSQVYTGMTISEFKIKVEDATLVQMIDNFTSYRLTERSARFGTPGGYEYETRFFYFKDNKLYRIDEGVRATDLKIEIEKYSK